MASAFSPLCVLIYLFCMVVGIPLLIIGQLLKGVFVAPITPQNIRRFASFM